MVCIAGLGRMVLIVVNTTTMLIGIAFIAGGVIIKNVLGEILRSNVFDTVVKIAFTLFVQNTPVPESIDFGPLTDTLGIIFIVFGIVLVILSIVGCVTACCNFKPILLAFSVLIGVLIVGQIIMWSVFLPRHSVIHSKAKKALEEDLRNDYNRSHLTSFTISADIIFLAAECCGVEGPDDFLRDHLSFSLNGRTFVDPEIPPSCCQHQYLEMLDWGCVLNKTMGHSQGCYNRLQDLIEDWHPWLVTVIIISLLVQVGEIIAAVMIYKDDGNGII